MTTDDRIVSIKRACRIIFQWYGIFSLTINKSVFVRFFDARQHTIIVIPCRSVRREVIGKIIFQGGNRFATAIDKPVFSVLFHSSLTAHESVCFVILQRNFSFAIFVYIAELTVLAYYRQFDVLIISGRVVQ